MAIITYNGKKYNTISDACFDNGHSNTSFCIFCKDNYSKKPSDMDRDLLDYAFKDFCTSKKETRVIKNRLVFNGKEYGSLTEACNDVGIDNVRFSRYCACVYGKGPTRFDIDTLNRVFSEFVDFSRSQDGEERVQDGRCTGLTYNGVTYKSLGAACIEVGKNIQWSVSKSGVMTYCKKRTGKTFASLSIDDRSVIFSDFIKYLSNKGLSTGRADEFKVFGKYYKSVTGIITSYGIFSKDDVDGLYDYISMAIEDYLKLSGKVDKKE